MSLVLIVDDEEAILDVAQDALAALGHDVVRAHDGEQALTLLRAQPPDLVVSDVMMPRRSGTELIEAMRSDPKLATIPVILMSAVRSAAVDGVRFLPKPLGLDAFEDAVGSALATHTRRASTPSTAAPSFEPEGARDRDGREAMFEWVAHELKTPLASVRMNAELAARRGTALDDGPLASSLGAVVRGVDRMTRMIDAILDAARFANGRVVIKPEARDLGEFLRDRLAEWRVQLPNARVHLALPDEPVVVQIDVDLFGQVLDNLVSNAVKYGRGAERIDVSLDAAPNRAVIGVRDYGRGIAAAELPRLFDRFHRAEGAEGKGHGLGLFIAAAIVRLHHGALSVRSELGEGATFTILLPLSAR